MASYLPFCSVDHRKLLRPPGTWPTRTWHGLCPRQLRRPGWARWPCGEDSRPVLGFQGWAGKETSWHCTHRRYPLQGRLPFWSFSPEAISGLASPWRVLHLMWTILLENMGVTIWFQTTTDTAGSSYSHCGKVLSSQKDSIPKSFRLAIPKGWIGCIRITGGRETKKLSQKYIIKETTGNWNDMLENIYLTQKKAVMADLRNKKYVRHIGKK